MLSEQVFSTVCGPPLTANTAVKKDIGIYAHTISPTYATKATFKKSSTAVNSLAVSDTHVFAAQDGKASVHVYSRQRANLEAYVPFPERLCCLTLVGDVLVVGTAEGRIFLWEIGTGRLISRAAVRHMGAVSCLVATQHHLISGSDDSNVLVWSLLSLVELEGADEVEPEVSLSNHGGPITALALAPGTLNAETSFCVSASKDKSCIIWNYHSGALLRILLFPTAPLCLSLDPAGRALLVSTDDGGDGALYIVELFETGKVLLGLHSAEDASTPVQVGCPFGIYPTDMGPAICLAPSYDGTSLLSGHAQGQMCKWELADNTTPEVLTNLNAAVTNLYVAPPLPPHMKRTTITNVVKPGRVGPYTLTVKIEPEVAPSADAPSRFTSLFSTPGFSRGVLDDALVTLQQQPPATAVCEQQQERHQQEIDELWEIINQQRAMQKQTLQHLLDRRGMT